MIFWVLDQNSTEQKYQGFEGFGFCMIDSYRLSLGDFWIAENFVGNTDYILIFWCIFFIATLISLLIILNMVIAVMGGTFGRV